MYGVYRTEILKKCVEKCYKKICPALDLMILLFIQRFGEINLINETLLHRSAKGMSGIRKKDPTIYNNIGIIGKFFPRLSFSYWIFRNLGPRLFFKNIDYILLINFVDTRYQIKQFFK